MRVPFSWLKEFVDVDLTAEEVAELLTMGGIEVEGVEDAYEQLGPVVVAEIKSVHPHPESQSLKICEVFDGNDSYTVVSGAPDLKEGLRVAFGRPGSITFSGTKIQERVIRGVKSQGMLFSPFEAGVSEDQDRILELPFEAELGRKFYEVLGLSEPVLEVAITPNRGDCLSIVGIAREVALLTGKTWRYPQVEEVEVGESGEVSVEVLEPELCPRYAGILIKGVEVKESPFWMRKRLWMCGLRGINNIVDVTNYVLLELGQPLHAFDWEKIAKRVVVRRAFEGEKIVTLDGQERVLWPEVLVIADEKRPIAIAGIMGGEESSVGSETRAVFLESAWFDPVSIRRTSKELKLSTESSYRFERGIDPEGVIRGARRAVYLFKKVAGGEVASPLIDKYTKKREVQRVVLRLDKLEGYLGERLEEDLVKDVLTRLGGECRSLKQGVLEFLPPSFRNDLSIEEDLIEEVARVYGYDRLPTRIPVGELKAERPSPEEVLLKQLKGFLKGLGFYEIITYSFVSPDSIKELGFEEGDERSNPISLTNPLSVQQSVMRTTLVPGLLSTLKYNVFREVERLKVFEVGRVFLKRAAGLPREVLSLGIALYGPATRLFWGEGSGRGFDIYDLKGILEALFEELSIEEVELIPFSEEPYLKRGASFSIKARGKFLGAAGELKDYIRERYELAEPVFLAEVNLDSLLELPHKTKKFKRLPKYPATFRDVTMVVDESLMVGEVLKFVEELKVPYLERVVVTDVYRGKPIPSGKKSVSLRFYYRSEERTLRDEEVNEIQEGVARKIFEKFRAEPR